jgi:serine/threonine protein phosphatase PrpC
MTVKINSESAISEQGRRNNNEDNFGFISGFTYIVCDGVGGAQKGEIASDITVRTAIDEFNNDPASSAIEVIRKVEGQLSDYQEKNPESYGMATTFTLVQNRESSLYVAWCGDSRVYQFRKGKILFKTLDHSWVNEALAAGILTKEEAINHPKSNVITRAIQGNHNKALIDERIITDIESGDYFLLCSDGIIEAWTDDDFEALFGQINSPESALSIIKEHCENTSKDNFTALSFTIDVIADEATSAPVIKENNSESELLTTENVKTTIKTTKKKKGLFIISIIFILIGVLIFRFYSRDPNTEKVDDSRFNSLKKTREKKTIKDTTIKLDEQKHPENPKPSTTPTKPERSDTLNN